jgi:amino acid transporter
MLSFISFWRAAAIVLCDLGSSAYYAGGIAESAVGRSAPWFILGIMLFSYAVRAVYVEGCSMFVRGGVYRVVQEALGPRMAKFAVSALLFDYVLTGPISAVSAGLYLAGLLNELLQHAGQAQWQVDPKLFATGLGVAVTLYFWRKNVIGVHESSQKALRIMQLTTAMVVILIVWSLITIAVKGWQPVPFPDAESMRYPDHALGWLQGTGIAQWAGVAILIGLGHSLLGMSGQETLAQVNREIASPKLKNLQRAGMVVWIYSLTFTSLVSFFAVMIIPDQERTTIFIDNLIGGLALHMAGPMSLRFLFHGFVVLVGAVILSGAVNTSILGANGVLNRVAEDGVLPDWFRHPHKRFGTTNRMINTIAGLQILTLLITRGNIALLGEAYAFGVAWSFTLKACSVLVLRYKLPGRQEWKVPLNFRIGGREMPVGLGTTALMLLSLALVNLFTKQQATVAGILFSTMLFLVFEASEKRHKARLIAEGKSKLEKFRLASPDEVTAQAVNVRPGGMLIAVRNPHRLEHVKAALDRVDTRRMDVVVMTVKLVTPAGSGESDLAADQVFTNDVGLLFSRVVEIAEKAGKHVELMVVPGANANEVVVSTAQRLQCSTILMGLSGRISPAQQAKGFGDAWEKLPEPRPKMSLQIVDPVTMKSEYFNLGPHPPRLWPEDEELLHKLWLELSDSEGGHKVHHRDVVRLALRRLEREWKQGRKKELLDAMLHEERKSVVDSGA